MILAITKARAQMLYKPSKHALKYIVKLLFTSNVPEPDDTENIRSDSNNIRRLWLYVLFKQLTIFIIIIRYTILY